MYFSISIIKGEFIKIFLQCKTIGNTYLISEKAEIPKIQEEILLAHSFTTDRNQCITGDGLEGHLVEEFLKSNPEII